jgi:hypothetical protein
MSYFLYDRSDEAVLSSKNLIRDHFATKYGEKFKVTLWQRIKDIYTDITGKGEKPVAAELDDPLFERND